MIIDLNRAAELLKDNDNILILVHGNPDGDTLGCGFALKAALTEIGKNAAVRCSDKIPPKYSYLGELDEDFDEDFVVAVDVADPKLLGKELETAYAGKIQLCIDHHSSNLKYADYTLLDSNAAAACEIILEIIKTLGVQINSKMANCIYTGLCTDTGCFKYSNVTPRTMRMAADMIEAGAENAKINTVMFDTKTRTYAKLEKLALDSMKLYLDGRCAVITITQDMYSESGSNETEVDAIAALPRQIEGVLVGVTMREKEDGDFKVSMRSHEPVDVSEICASMGGGGHRCAGGCKVAGPADKAAQTVLMNVEKYLDRQ
ncbi:MAG: bifunctional oligoribonuclease/PAP phosphatase NrnA [Clostridia bacterium]|nr:bifunctional oligoribonuclease/PAP phosphatase NrnA [Clostridia bacterium]